MEIRTTINHIFTKAVLVCLLITGVLLFNSCNKNAKDETNGIFNLKSYKESKLDFSNDLVDTDSQNIIEYLYYYNGGGVAIGDINNDGLEDVFFTANQQSDRLYLNKGNLVFQDITKEAGIFTDNSWSTGVTMDDVNGDGLLDIYVCRVFKFCEKEKSHNLLYINQGNNKFKEMSKELGLAFSGYSTQSCFLDYDKDGDLDMYLLNHTVHSVRSYGTTEKRKEKDALSGDLLFENRIKEEGKFVDVTEASGIYNSPLGYGLAVSCGDVNGDGFTDIYIGNDFHENDYLYINNGDKTFTESINQYCSNTSQFSMGVDIADMNNDGWADIFTTDMMPYEEEVALVSGGEDTENIKRIKEDFGFETQYARNHFQLNSGKGYFSEIAQYTRTFATDWSWTVLLQDFDNNMLNDVFITTGIVKRPNDLDYINYLTSIDTMKNLSQKEKNKKLLEKMPSQAMKNVLFKQESALKFTSINESLIGPKSFSTGAAHADLDNDGDIDIITNNINEKAFLFENTASKNGNYISVILMNDDSIYATSKNSVVKVFIGNTTITKELNTTKGFLSSSSHKLHFGLKDKKTVDSIEVQWPDNTIQKLYKVKSNQQLKIKKTSGTKRLFQKSSSPNFAILPFKHSEDKFFDDDTEKLIPEKLSYEGPALICEDLNGDGIKDIYAGGARNQKAKLLLGTKDGRYVEKPTPDFDRDAKYEDVDAATIDFDNDGDRDIYVVSGGNDHGELSKILEDRIYLNNGNGVFKRIPISLPHTNGSCVAVADIDGDGFEDLFIGARNIPGSYGLSPYSFLLKNNQGQGLAMVQKERYGMITDAKFADIDYDGDQDLIMCGDWMPVKIYENKGNNKFEDITEKMGLANHTGFWNAVALVDLNNDKKLDIIAGNIGLNTKLTASDSLPIKLYVGDFDKNSSSDPLMFYYFFNSYIPFASFDKMASQLPIVKKKYRTYQSYRKVKSIEEIFPKYTEDVIVYKEVNELRSMVFLSNAKGYEAIPLDREQQWSNINDFEITESKDVYYVGNRFSYTADIGKTSSNPGGKLSKFDSKNKRFMLAESIDLPHDKSLMKIKLLKDNKLVVASNNDNLYLIE